jgi:hypothetical protein
MSRLRDWWRRLAGTPPEVQEPPRGATPPPRPDPSSDALEVVEAPPARKPSRVGAAGFDPYSSDAGYSKPHSWERVDHD